MKIINRSRGSGKTTILIHAACATGNAIIVSSQERKKHVLELAESLDMSIEIYDFEEWNKLNHFLKFPHIFVDDAEDFIYSALHDFLGGSCIDAATMTIPMDNIECSEDTDRKHGKWEKFEDCSNEGVYCSVCHKKVFKLHYANQALQSKYCPNCGAKMDSLED